MKIKVDYKEIMSRDDPPVKTWGYVVTDNFLHVVGMGPTFMDAIRAYGEGLVNWTTAPEAATADQAVARHLLAVQDRVGVDGLRAALQAEATDPGLPCTCCQAATHNPTPWCDTCAQAGCPQGRPRCGLVG